MLKICAVYRTSSYSAIRADLPLAKQDRELEGELGPLGESPAQTDSVVPLGRILSIESLRNIGAYDPECPAASETLKIEGPSLS